MGGVLARSVELVYATSPAMEPAVEPAVIELTEVEKGQTPSQGKLILTLWPGQRTWIRGTQFLNRHRNSSIPRSVHATAKLPSHESVKILTANDFAVNGKFIFWLEEGEVMVRPVKISNFRRLRFFPCTGEN